MEGCPRSLMLNVDLKEAYPTEFAPSLKTVQQDKRVDFICSQFSRQNPLILRLFSVYPRALQRRCGLVQERMLSAGTASNGKSI